MDLLPGPAQESLENAPPLSRSELAVGARIPLPAFQAQSARNNMSWKGSQVFRVAALQAVGVGTVPDFVGHWWGSSLS